ncbi:MAG: adenosylmethionine--8-amino-7-oxononanoate transaminase [Thioalkalivibrionaceae bacterium]
MNNADWIHRDLRVLWHPCTQMKDHDDGVLPLIPIARGDGVWLYDFDGRRYFDGISSWWVNLFGHANPRINDAIAEQLDRVEHVMLAGFTHRPAIELSERLIRMTPEGLDRVFFADNGSAGVEVALKMSHHYWRNLGRPEKSGFVTLANSYHGETLGTLGVGDVALYREQYRPLMHEALVAPTPDCYAREPGESCADVARRAAAGLEALLAGHHASLAALIVEPLVQCAGGMRMYDPEYLRLARALCTQYDVHLIADEIAVGFGRTGTLFAIEQAGIVPDYLCLSKGLTGGYLPLAVTVTRGEIFDAFYDDYVRLNAFLHSHSYTGNPLACAAANATLDLFDSEPVLEDNRLKAGVIAEGLASLNDHPHVADVRQTGMIAAVEMAPDRSRRVAYPWQERRGLSVYRYGLTQGAILRPLGVVSYLMPPYVATEDELRWVCGLIREGVDRATRGAG